MFKTAIAMPENGFKESNLNPTTVRRKMKRGLKA